MNTQFAKLSQKLHEIKRILMPRGGGGRHASLPPLDPPIKSVKIYRAQTPPYLALSKILAKQTTPGQDLVYTHEYQWMGNSRNQKSIQFFPPPFLGIHGPGMLTAMLGPNSLILMQLLAKTLQNNTSVYPLEKNGKINIYI